MNADQVYQKVKQADPSIGIATVYRNLNLLTEMGEIQKFQDRSAGFMYDGNPKKHHHFYCRYCKRYFDVSFSVEEQMIRQVEEDVYKRQCQRIAEANYADLILLDGASKSIKKDEILSLQERFNKTGLERSGQKVYILNNAENTTCLLYTSRCV